MIHINEEQLKRALYKYKDKIKVNDLWSLFLSANMERATNSFVNSLSDALGLVE